MISLPGLVYGTRAGRVLTGAISGGVAHVPLAAAVAWADGPRGTTAMSPFDAVDSRGIHISQYQLSIDNGGVTSPGKALWAWPVTTGWEAYRWAIGILAWLVDWVIGFSWLDWIAKPFGALANALKVNVLDPTTLVTGVTAAAAFVVGWWIVKGRYATGIVEMLVSCLLLVLAAGVLANPVGLVSGQGGPLDGARNAGVEIANLVTSGGAVSSRDPAQLRANTSGMITDTFIRVPHQLLNYNAVIDSDSACVDVYDKALRGGPYKGDDDAARSALGKCNKAYKEYADNPNAGQLMTLLAVMVSGLLLGLFAVMLSVLLFIAVLMTLYEAVKLVINLVVGVIPGTSRGGLIDGVANLAVMVLAVFSMTVMLGGYLFVVRSALADAKGVPPLVRFALADLVLIAGTVVLWRVWKAHGKTAETMRNRLRKAAAPKANQLGKASAPARLANWARQAPKHAQHREMVNALHNAGGGGGDAGTEAGGRGGSRRPPGRITSLLNRTNAGHSLVLAGQGARAGGKGARRAGKLAVSAGKLAAMTTVGAPVYGPRAAKLAKDGAKKYVSAKTARVSGRLDTAKAFGQEYRHNVAAPVRGAQAAGRGAQAAKRAASWRIAPLKPGVSDSSGRARSTDPGQPHSPHARTPKPSPESAAASAAPPTAQAAPAARRGPTPSRVRRRMAGRRPTRGGHPGDNGSD